MFFFFKNLDPSGKTSILVLFARIAAIFDQLEVESSSNMKWKANSKLKDALTSKLLSGATSIFYAPPGGGVVFLTSKSRTQKLHTAVVSLGVTPSISIFAKETCFQGPFPLNSGCTMRGMVSPRLVGPGAGPAQALSSIM